MTHDYVTHSDYASRSEAETRALARDLADGLLPGMVVAITGGLGVGKTVFAAAVAQQLGVREPVTSPTFTLINEYNGRVPVYHIDLYRLNSPEECETIGLEEYIWSGGITIIEWSERAGALIPDHAIRVGITSETAETRRITIEIPSETS
jgi:tRNA threonylcarbamoyladenosine biosynthesis protein TsaE